MVLSVPHLGKELREETFLMHQQVYPLVRSAFTTSRKHTANCVRLWKSVIFQRAGSWERAHPLPPPTEGASRTPSIGGGLRGWAIPKSRHVERNEVEKSLPYYIHENLLFSVRERVVHIPKTPRRRKFRRRGGYHYFLLRNFCISFSLFFTSSNSSITAVVSFKSRSLTPSK